MSRCGARISQVRMCARCHVLEAHNCAYCQECKRIKSRERYRLRTLGAPDLRSSKARKARDSNACNCGNAGCNGLTCDVVSA